MNGPWHWTITRLGWAPGTLAAVIVAAGHEVGPAPIEVAVLTASWLSVWLWLAVLIREGARVARHEGRP